jgi:hypothetical protein
VLRLRAQAMLHPGLRKPYKPFLPAGQKYFHCHLNVGEEMNIRSLPFNFYLFVFGAISNAIFSFRAETFFISCGLGISAVFFLIAAFRVFWRIKHNKDI